LTIPTYVLFRDTALPPEFPPLADLTVTNKYDHNYVGNKEIEHRVRRAMSAYAASRFPFWQYSLLIVLLGGLTQVFGAQAEPWWFPIVLVGIVIVIGSFVPLKVLVEIARAAKVYARPGEEYLSSFGSSSFTWKTPQATYEVHYDQINRVMSRSRVVILGLRSSRAICVLPYELMSAERLDRLKRLP
jgi:hypothetical protein